MDPANAPVLLITGASSGIGAATARAASERGYRLVLAARSQDRLAGLADELGGEERAAPVRCDVTRWEDVREAIATATERFGRLDAVLANAGFGAKRGFTEETVEHLRAMVDTNVTGVAFTIRAALPVLLAQGSGHVLLVGSVAGRRALPGSLYSATKWAVTAMGEALRAELRQMHENSTIRVTLIEPGMVDTPFFDERPERALEPQDVARAILYALEQPPHVDVNEVLVRPTSQPL